MGSQFVKRVELLLEGLDGANSGYRDTPCVILGGSERTHTGKWVAMTQAWDSYRKLFIQIFHACSSGSTATMLCTWMFASWREIMSPPPPANSSKHLSGRGGHSWRRRLLQVVQMSCGLRPP
jgi:hypothetical protein